MLEKNKLIIFDYDGVIVDSFPGIYETYKVIGKELGKQIEGNIGDFKKEYGDDYEVYCHKIGIMTAEEKSKTEIIYEREILKKTPHLFAGIKEVIAELSKNYILGLVSATYKSEVLSKLEPANLTRFFKQIVAKETRTFEHLNKTQEVLKMVSFFGIEQKNVLAIGDKTKDYAFFTSAGIKNILLVDYGWGFDKEKTPNRIQYAVNGPKDILGAIKSINF